MIIIRNRGAANPLLEFEEVTIEKNLDFIDRGARNRSMQQSTNIEPVPTSFLRTDPSHRPLLRRRATKVSSARSRGYPRSHLPAKPRLSRHAQKAQPSRFEYHCHPYTRSARVRPGAAASLEFRPCQPRPGNFVYNLQSLRLSRPRVFPGHHSPTQPRFLSGSRGREDLEKHRRAGQG